MPDVPVAHADRRMAVLSVFVFWALYFVLNTLRAVLMHSPNQLDMMLRRGVVVAGGIAVTFILYALLYRFEGKSMRTMLTIVFVSALPASFLYALTNFAVFYLVAPMASSIEEMEKMRAENIGMWSVLLELAVNWYFFLAAWASLYVALSYAARSVHAERRAVQYRAEAQTAQLQALRYQVNPHFLFNTLNSLAALVLNHRTGEADRMIVNLATFFRTSLATDTTDDVALADEIEIQRLYLDIEQVRFPDRLAVEVDLPPALAAARVPSLILQPIVENAIKHGVARVATRVTVAIRAAASNDVLRLSVENDAVGPAVGTGVGVGLRNVRSRLETRFAGAASCAYGPTPAGGFRVELTMPLQFDA
ncbi:MAG: histidine kinase [Rhodospirillaceae bacterium]|nr:histidine kinase [Rhodospirillaceae bacterium]